MVGNAQRFPYQSQQWQSIVISYAFKNLGDWGGAPRTVVCFANNKFPFIVIIMLILRQKN
jgi:hypothetical protein